MKFKATEDIDAPLELVFERFCDFTQIEADLTGRGAKLVREGGWLQPRKGKGGQVRSNCAAARALFLRKSRISSTKR
jgi:hypothetical protein